MPETTTRRSVLRALGAGMVAGSLGAWSLDAYVDALTIERHELRLPRWDADGFRVAVLADLHMNNARQLARAQKACRMASAEKPDLIVVVGDFINFTRADMAQSFAEALSPLGEAGCPVLGVLGNHDYWSRFPERVIEAISASPVRLLRNELVDVDGVQVAGIDDAIVNRYRLDFFPEQSSARSLIALLHEPDFADEMPRHVSLQLSGHSHGGQVCLPGGVPIKPPPFGEKYVAGFFESTPAPLYVTRGVGTTGPDFRLFCRPEVSVLTLRSA